MFDRDDWNILGAALLIIGICWLAGFTILAVADMFLTVLGGG